MKKNLALTSYALVFLCIILLLNCSKSKDSSKDSAAPGEILFAYSSGSSESSSLTRLVNSSRYAAIQEFIESYGTPALSSATVVYYNNDTSKPWITIPVINRTQLRGFVRIVRVAESKVSTIGTTYIASFIAFSNGFTTSNPSGTVEIYDLDDHNQLVGQYIFTNGSPTSDLLYEGSKKHYCDKNNNGNVTFAECMTCLIGACFSNTECAAQCIVYQFLADACLVSFSTACQIISIIY